MTVTETEKSKTALSNELERGGNYDVSEAQAKDLLTEDELSHLHDVKIETIKEDENRKSNSYNYGSFNYTLNKSSKIKVANETKKGETTATISLNSANVSAIRLTHDGKTIDGRWILVYFGIRGNTNTVVDKTDSNDIIIDIPNRDKLLTSDKGSISGADLIPLWINLDGDEIRKATKHGKEDVTPFAVKFGSSDPVEEENYFKLIINDENANSAPIPESAKPEGMSVDTLEEGKSTKENVAKLFPEDEEETKKHLKDRNTIDAFIHNQKALKDFDIDREIVGDTVYVTVKGDYKKLKSTDNQTYSNGKNFNVSFDLDLSSIIESGKTDAYFYNDGTNKWISTKVDNTRHCHFGLTIYNKFTDISQTNGLTKEYIFSNTQGQDSDKDCSKLTGKYIRYVFNFIHED